MEQDERPLSLLPSAEGSSREAGEGFLWVLVIRGQKRGYPSVTFGDSSPLRRGAMRCRLIHFVR